MHTLFLLSVWIINVLVCPMKCDFTPLVAFHENLPLMYKTDNGWVADGSDRTELPKSAEIIKLCKKIYPNNNITRAVPIFKKELLTNWCKVNQSCSAENQYEINPIECVNKNYSSKPMITPSYCKFYTDHREGCLPFERWKEIAKTKCIIEDSVIRDLQVIFPCEKHQMFFNEVEFTCCSDKDEIGQFSKDLRSKINDILKNSTSTYIEYHQNKKSQYEHKLFSNAKHTLLKAYNISLDLLYSDLIENMKIIVKQNGKLTLKTEVRLFEIFKINYKALIHEFNRKFFHLDNEHIRRIIKKSEKWCHNKNNTTFDINRCLKDLRLISDRIVEHLHRMIAINILNWWDYIPTIEGRLRQMYRKYLTITPEDVTWSNRFREQLETYCQKLKVLNMTANNTQEYTIVNNFRNCKMVAMLYFQNKGHYMSSASIICVIAIVTFVIIAIISVVSYKYCSGRFRRGSPNYVMRVVTEADRPSNSVNGSDVKLNLYENPIFNSKSSSREIEKQLLIEHMEN